MYEPNDNEFNDEFDVAKIEQMKVEFKTCYHCGASGTRNNGIYTFNCSKCNGCGEIPKGVKSENM